MSDEELDFKYPIKRRQRKEQKLKVLQKEHNVRMRELNQLRSAYVIATDANEIFRLKIHIQAEETRLVELEEDIERYEQDLQMLPSISETETDIKKDLKAENDIKEAEGIIVGIKEGNCLRESSDDDMQQSKISVNVAVWRQLLNKYFDVSELQGLCFDLAIDYESLLGQGKVDKTRELIAHVTRHGRTTELLTECKKQRPNIDWSKIVQPNPSEHLHKEEVKSRVYDKQTKKSEHVRLKATKRSQVETLLQLDRLEVILSDLVILQQDISVWNSEMSKEEWPILKPDNLETLKSRIQSVMQQSKDFRFNIVFVGATNTGKSMMINAIVGKKLLPSQNTFMTILPTIITHTPERDTPLLILPQPTIFNQMIVEIREEVTKRNILKFDELGGYETLSSVYHEKPFSRFYNKGEREVNQILTKINNITWLYTKLGLINLADEFKTVDKFPVVEVEFAGLLGKDWIPESRLSLIDTPSFGESELQIDLRGVVIDLLSEAPAVAHVLDYMMLDTDEERALRVSIQRVQELVGGNLFVLLNKFDQAMGGSLDKDSAVNYICTEIYPKRQVKRNLVRAVDASRVFLVSAKQAFYANIVKRILSEHKQLPQEDWIEDWGLLAYGAAWRRSLQNSQESHLAVCDALYLDSNVENFFEKVILHSFEKIIPLCLKNALVSAREISVFLKNTLGLIKSNIEEKDFLTAKNIPFGQRLEISSRIQNLYEKIDELLRGIGDVLKNPELLA